MRSIEMSFVEPDMGGFFRQVQSIERDLESVSKLLKMLHDANEKSKFVVKSSALKDIRKRMETNIEEVKNIALAVKSELEKLDRDNLTNRLNLGCGEGSSTNRTRMAITAQLKNKWKQMVVEFQVLRDNIRQEYRDVVDRTVFAVTGNRLDVEAIDQLINTGNHGQIYQTVIQEQGRGQVMDTLMEIQNRHETLKELEKQILELQQIFLDISVLVEIQGETLDTAESQVSNAVIDIKDAAGSLQKAKSLQHKSWKWIIIGIVLVLSIAAVIVLAVLKPWHRR